MDIQEIIKNAPDSAGVYIMKDKAENILYVGKAKSLKERLKSYISKPLSHKQMALLSLVSTIEYRTTPNE
ncbi:MAG: nucleotide excision repair endonuclease, partial [Candidatus Omnitrophica bacterium]|nr:nucleotide excision repair endonuclease [Candidatus Omnitrophota bacterium]